MKEEIIGLVFCGGKSSRMGQDKMWLNYYGKPQAYYIYEQMQNVCKKVYISCNKSQHSKISTNYNCIVDDDLFGDIGPMKALLTAFKNFPKASFLVVGCDYPFLTKQDINLLYNEFITDQKTVSFYQSDESIFEPLLAGYQNDIFSKLNSQFQLKNYSLSKLLALIDAKKLIPPNPDILKSIDTNEAYLLALKQLNAIQTNG